MKLSEGEDVIVTDASQPNCLKVVIFLVLCGGQTTGRDVLGIDVLILYLSSEQLIFQSKLLLLS